MENVEVVGRVSPSGPQVEQAACALVELFNRIKIELARAIVVGIQRHATAGEVEAVICTDIGGENYVRESWLRADLAIIKAWRADPSGNLMFRKTARNFNPIMATAAKVTVVEVEEIVAAGTFDPDCIHTPSIYVDRIVRSTINEKRIEKLTVRARDAA